MADRNVCKSDFQKHLAGRNTLNKSQIRQHTPFLAIFHLHDRDIVFHGLSPIVLQGGPAGSRPAQFGSAALFQTSARKLVQENLDLSLVLSDFVEGTLFFNEVRLKYPHAKMTRAWRVLLIL